MRDYLRQRERAGVGALSSGLLVLVIALAESETHMRCLIVNALTTVGEIGAQLPHATRLPLADQQSPVIKTEPRAEPCAPEAAQLALLRCISGSPSSTRFIIVCY
ncbi:hypothetical protein ATCC90586_010535 [Pythium insidiosum]|nr:hypothetical protein ATCC90586_010535 [Pythium insidiosum]